MCPSDGGASDGGDEIAALVERAFHYRGDVTVRTAEGLDVTGYLFNRDARSEAPWAQLFETDSRREVEILYRDIRDVLFTGRDTAAPNRPADASGATGHDRPEARRRTVTTP